MLELIAQLGIAATKRARRLGPLHGFLTPADTLSIRYAFSTADIQHSGVGGNG
jgi:hypothetical protein